ncbi:MAG: histidine kinase, partial [Bacteroidota bacterium]
EDLSRNIDHLQAALTIADSLQANQILRDAHKYLADAYEHSGDFQQSLHHLRLYNGIHDSLYTAEENEQIIALQAKYDAEKKDRENAELRVETVEKDLEIESRDKWIWAATGGMLLLLLVIAGLVFRHRIKRQREEALFMQKQARLEQQALRAQMNPHFLFNSLNAIQHMYITGETSMANDYLSDFGELLRNILDNSGKETIPLKEELNTLNLYLELEQVRAEGMLTYHMDVDPELDLRHTRVPPLIVQPFVENAIWHGILPKKSPGNVTVKVRPMTEQRLLVCEVEDDGVGIGAVPKRKDHESKGIALTEQRLGTSVEIQALAPGTRITLYIPIG